MAADTAELELTIDFLFPGTEYNIEVETVVGTDGTQLRSQPSAIQETTGNGAVLLSAKFIQYTTAK